jgi:hypothetical protein
MSRSRGKNALFKNVHIPGLFNIINCFETLKLSQRSVYLP